jgi:multiple sugar transport system substrate-binding protein
MFPYISEIEAEIAVYLEAAVITGEMTPKQAMDEAAKAVQLILDDYWASR